ncbi:MAG: TIGR02217 family protein [Rhodoblastus sp.]
MNGFHEILFPLDIALGARGGPERRTEIVALGSNREKRNARWARSRRRWEAGYGVKTFADLAAIVEFFEERRGRLYGFRWRDRFDHSSAKNGQAPLPTDQPLGQGDGVRKTFQLVKIYGGAFAPYAREIAKPVMGSVRMAVAGAEIADPQFSVDSATGLVTLASAPAAGAPVTAGFRFDTPARFDADFLEIDQSGFEAGDIPKIPVLEILS